MTAPRPHPLTRELRIARRILSRMFRDLAANRVGPIAGAQLSIAVALRDARNSGRNGK